MYRTKTARRSKMHGVEGLPFQSTNEMASVRILYNEMAKLKVSR